ncbi:MAG: TfoX/Sxy family protein [Saprospiraceae bacterium]|nr:TfoX/Sxy family protein [Saprospiraceae bacterium]
MAVKEEFVNYINDQLSNFAPFETKKMFGGIGFFKDGLMFAMIGGNTFRLKVDDSNQNDFEKRGMTPYQNDSKKKGMPYWEVPLEVIEDKTELKKWAGKAFQVATKTKK